VSRAVIVMTHDDIADRPDLWLERRRRTPDGRWCVTASEMAKVCGIAPRSHGGPYKLYWDKLMGRETEDTAELRRGRALEPIVLAEFADSHPGLTVLPGGMYCREDTPWLLATLDGQAFEHDTLAAFDNRWGEIPEAEIMVVEAKTAVPMDEWGLEEDTDQVPDNVRAQVLIQAHVRGARQVFVAVKPVATWGPVKTYLIEIGDRERAEIAWMIAQAQEFTKRLDAEDPPPVDWYPDTTKELRRRFPGSDIDPELRAWIPIRLARRYRALSPAEDKVDRRKGQVQNEILARAGNAGEIWTTDGGRPIKVATRTSAPRKEIIIEAKDHVDRLNRCGWAKRKPRRER